MCTALSFKTKDHYFGRTLDLDRSYGEEVCVVPRSFGFDFRCMGKMETHYAMMGMAIVSGGYPLFYDAVNEHGLSMAGLNFPKNAYYFPFSEGHDNVSPFEFIPWILSQCKNTDEARVLLSRINLVDIPFGEGVPLAPLHFMISDKDFSLVVESMSDGIHIHENPMGVMTNNPPFEYQKFNLNNYRGISADNGDVKFSCDLPFDSYCQGLGAMGLPGDVSSMSRFVRASFGRENSVCEDNEASSVSQFFHILGSVSMNRGVCRTDSGVWDITVYTSCVNTELGRYYYTTYDNSRISCVDMRRCDLDGEKIIRFPLQRAEDIYYHN